MEKKVTKIKTLGSNAVLKVQEGHFATSHAHTNYYIDVTTLKSRASAAQEVARSLVAMYSDDTVIDTIVCMEGTEVIGAYMAEELTRGDYPTANSHKTIYVIGPEFHNDGHIIFRDNVVPMVRGKHVLVLLASVSSGLTVSRALECVEYYEGIVSGVSAIFSAQASIHEMPIKAVFGRKDLPEYAYYDYKNCPLCKAGVKLDALVNPHGYSAL